MKLLLLSTLFISTALATIGGRCAGSYNNGVCICEKESTCNSYKSNGRSIEIVRGRKGSYPCPYDAADVIGCEVFDCHSGGVTGCAFNDYCAKEGTVVPGNLCPGGSNFLCCRY